MKVGFLVEKRFDDGCEEGEEWWAVEGGRERMIFFEVGFVKLELELSWVGDFKKVLRRWY